MRFYLTPSLDDLNKMDTDEIREVISQNIEIAKDSYLKMQEKTITAIGIVLNDLIEKKYDEAFAFLSAIRRELSQGIDSIKKS